MAAELVLLYRAGGPRLAALLLNVVFVVTLSSGMRFLGHEQRVRRPRGLGSAAANLGIPALLALPLLLPAGDSLRSCLNLAISAALGSALADSLSHDIGVFDPSAWSIATWRAVRPGQDGGVSALGSMAGFLTAITHSFLVFGLGLSDAAGVPIVLFSVCAGNAADSLLGATLQQRGLLSNAGVNLLATACAAVCGAGLRLLF